MPIPPSYDPPSISSLTPPPPSKPRPSLPVRAAKRTAVRSPWIAVGAAIVEILHIIIPLLK